MKKKVDRNRRLYEFWLLHNTKHGSTYKDVAHIFHISPSRAWRIIRKFRENNFSGDWEIQNKGIGMGAHDINHKSAVDVLPETKTVSPH